MHELVTPVRLLAGGGLSCPDPRVLRALSTPLVGQFDPAFTAIMDEVSQLGRRALLTANGRCFPVSGLASAGLEALLNSLVEPEDAVLVAGCEPFPSEVGQVAQRYGAELQQLTCEPAQDLDPDALARALRHHPARLVIVPHVDPSWGVLHPVADLARICHRQDAWLLVDARLSLGGCELRTDDWQLDGVAAGVDACLGGPSGMALVTFSQALEQRMLARRAPPTTSYLDLLQLRAYWSPERLNHHTAPTSLVYGLREALRLLSLEGLEATWQRHRQVGDALMAGLKALGFAVPGEVTSRAPHMCVVRPPEGVPADEARWRLLDEFGVYVGRGPDETWRIGLLGADARHESALRLLAALEQVRLSYGQAVEPGAARREALATLASQPAQPAQPAPPAQAAW